MLRGSGCSSASDSQVGKPYLAGLERREDETDALRVATRHSHAGLGRGRRMAYGLTFPDDLHYARHTAV